MRNDLLAAQTRNASPAGTAITWIGIGLAVIGALLVLLPGPGYRAHIWSLGTAFSLIRWGAYCGIAAAILSLLGLIVLVATRARRWRAFAVAGIVIGGLSIGVPYAWLQHARGVPAIHDISTDTSNPPQFQAVLAARKDAPNSPIYGGATIAAAQHAAYPDIRPILLTVPSQQAFTAALAVVRQNGWQVQAQDPATGHIEATATTFWFGFKDDIVIRVRAQGTGSVVDIRSESRIGKSDVGKNAARIRHFTQQIKDRAAKNS